MILPPEGFPADVAGVRPFVSMGPLVDQQVVALGELPVAVLADELLLGPHACCRHLRSQRRPCRLSQIVELVPGLMVDGGVSEPLVHEHRVVAGIAVLHGVVVMTERGFRGLRSVPRVAGVAAGHRRGHVPVGGRVGGCEQGGGAVRFLLYLRELVGFGKS